MRNPPRLSSVPLGVLISIVPFTFSSFVGPAGADTSADCEAAFSAGTSRQLVYTTDPPTRLAFSGQTVRLSAAWDPSDWDSLATALACVRLDENTFDGALGTSQSGPVNGGSFEHSFTIPDFEQGTRLCTRIRLTGDPAGEATAGEWVSKMHCFEVDPGEDEAPPDDDDTTTPTTAAPSTTTTTAPAPASSSGDGDEPPAADAPQDSPSATPEAPPSPPFDSAGSVPPLGSGAPVFPRPAGPEAIPLLPATGSNASLDLVQMGQFCFFTGLGLLALFGRRRRRLTA
ncbi:MAG TPA: hypothetical protein VEG38_09260 [Acidimicrobiia bacterium]|nr:hypothetical protein [Acidimicrobiia bacterium]